MSRSPDRGRGHIFVSVRAFADESHGELSQLAGVHEQLFVVGVGLPLLIPSVLQVIFKFDEDIVKLLGALAYLSHGDS